MSPSLLEVSTSVDSSIWARQQGPKSSEWVSDRHTRGWLLTVWVTCCRVTLSRLLCRHWGCGRALQVRWRMVGVSFAGVPDTCLRICLWPINRHVHVSWFTLILDFHDPYISIHFVHGLNPVKSCRIYFSTPWLWPRMGSECFDEVTLFGCDQIKPCQGAPDLADDGHRCCRGFCKAQSTIQPDPYGWTRTTNSCR